jgi:hypothetical protein
MGVLLCVLLCALLTGCPTDRKDFGGIEFCVLNEPPNGTIVTDQQIRLYQGTVVAIKVQPVAEGGEYLDVAVTLGGSNGATLGVEQLMPLSDSCDGPEGDRHFVLYGVEAGEATLTITLRNHPPWVIPVTILEQ